MEEIPLSEFDGIDGGHVAAALVEHVANAEGRACTFVLRTRRTQRQDRLLRFLNFTG